MTNFLLKPHFCDELLLAFSLNRIIRDVMNNVTKQCDEFNSPRCFITFGNCCESAEHHDEGSDFDFTDFGTIKIKD